MNPRIRELQRLAELYGTVERMKSVELRAAASAVTEADVTLDRERVGRVKEGERGRVALQVGDRERWVMAASETELSGLRARKVEAIREVREAAREEAQDEYRASRIRMQQMQQLVKSLEQREARVADRRAQTAMDDRHLSRTLWVERRKGDRRDP